ncbi:hypothetical protein [Pantanalinema sp. GBBB05]
MSRNLCWNSGTEALGYDATVDCRRSTGSLHTIDRTPLPNPQPLWI